MRLDLKRTGLEKILLLGFFLSGYAALTYEIIWVQLLSLIFGSSTYSYSILIGAFLTGLGIGSYIFGKLAYRIKDPVLALAWIEWGVGFSALLVLPFFERLDVFYLKFLRLDMLPWLAPVGWIGLTAFLIIPTALMGAKFPVAARFYSTSRVTRGRDMGVLYAVNTLGAVFAGWWTGFVFLPKLGLENTYILATLVNFSVAFMIFGFVLRLPWSVNLMIKVTIIGLSILFILLTLSIHGKELDTRFAGVYYIGPEMGLEEWTALKRDSNILFNKFSPYGLVTVGEDAGIKYLSVDGKPEASNGPFDLDGQYLLGYLPMFAHNDPKKVLHIGAGAGFTLDAIRNFEVERVDAVEINPLVIESGRRFFSNETNNVFSDTRVNFIIEDGRMFLLGSDEKYDVIITTPSNPWVSGSSTLFTVEFYDLALNHLEEGGVFAAWAPLYEFDYDDISVYLNTLRSVFPEVTVFVAGGDMIMLASKEPIEISFSRLLDKTKDERISRHFAKIGTYYGVQIRDPEKLPLTYRLNTGDLNRFITQTEVSTDDKSVLEFRAAKKAILEPNKKGLYYDTIHNIHAFKSTFTPPLVEVVSQNGSEKEFKHIMLKVEEGDGWVLDSWAYNFIFLPTSNVLAYSTDKFVRYSLPHSEVLFITQTDIFPEPSNEEKEMYLKEFLGPDKLKYEGIVDMRRQEEKARAYSFSLAEGLLKGAAYLWYCKGNEALYIAAVAYPVDADVDIEEPLSRLECTH